MDVKTFETPTMRYRAKPFWAWNGALDKKELLKQVEIISKMGFGGFFMHSRTGLATEYLGDEWFDLINECADKGHSLGLEAWLYDEDRWPSGSVSGEVTKNPDYRMCFLRMTYTDFPEWENSLAVFAIEEEDGFLKSSARINKETPTEELNGKKLIQFTIGEMPCSSVYNGNTYLDTLNREATEKFLELTHEKYKQRCGSRIGSSILGIFTDEPHRGALMSSFGSEGDCGERQIPYTKKLAEVFIEKYKYDLTEHLPDLFLRRNTKPSKIKWQYTELLQELFLENFAKPIDKWCRENHMIFTGHILHENSLTSQAAMSGSMMRFYEHMEAPGIDYLGEFERCYWIAKQLQSVARQLGKKQLLSELNGCTGWQMSFESYKAIGDWQALYGINMRCPHLSWYTMQGQAKRDYPASILHQSAWWKEYSYLEDYYARIAEFTAEGKPLCKVLVLNPIESIWAGFYPGWCGGLSATDPHIAALEKCYRELFFQLQQNHIDFDYGDEGLLTFHGSTKNGILNMGLCSYEAVVVSGVDTIRKTTMELLYSFAAEGGKLIICGEPPSCVDCEEVAMEWNEKRIDTSEQAVVKALVEYSVKIRNKDGNSVKEILCQAKEDENEIRIMLLNDNRENSVCDAVLQIKAEGPVTRFVPETGKLLGHMYTKTDNLLEIPIELEAKGVILLAISKKNIPYEQAKVPISFNPIEKKVQCGLMEYELSEDNVCVLDYATVSINFGEESESMEILKADRYLRDAFSLPYRGGEMLQPWFVNRQKADVKGNVTLNFTFFAEYISTAPILLAMEEAELFKASINGISLTKALHDFRWVDVCYRGFEISPELLHMGENILQLSTEYKETSNLEALFLLGGFGVRIEGNRRIITKLPEMLEQGDIVGQGLPFYSGEITYLLPIKKSYGKAVQIHFDSFSGGCIRVEGNGKKTIIAWKPYQADVTDLIENDKLRVTILLTRRNTFGPLHQIPAVWKYCDPACFETEGAQFSENYSLIPSGLTASVSIIYGK